MGSIPSDSRAGDSAARTPDYRAAAAAGAPPTAARGLAAPATYLLVAINCLVFLAMVAHHVSAISPTADQLMDWGADNAGSVLIRGEWWRIVTAMFVHVGIIHLATNMWCLWNLGLLAEPLMGSAGVLAVYILTGAAGNLLSTLVNWCVGAATAILGQLSTIWDVSRRARELRARFSALPER